MHEQFALQNYLRVKLSQYQSSNPAFSQRALAKKVKMSPGALSGILNGKRTVSYSVAEKILSNIEGDNFEKNEILKLFAKKSLLKTLPGLADKDYSLETDEVVEEEFRQLTSWLHFAVLSLFKVKDFQADASWMAERLGVETSDVTTVLERLVSLGFIQTDETNQLQRTQKRLPISESIQPALGQFYQKNLKDLSLKFENLPHEIQDLFFLIFPGDSRRLAQARVYLRRFADDLANLMESEDSGEVFRLGIQLHPLTKI